MKKIISIIIPILACLLNSPVQAGTCEIHGNTKFSVGFTVTGSNAFQAVYFEHNGNHPEEVAWYTQRKKGDTSNEIYHFNEQDLTNGQVYEIQIFHDAKNNSLSKYYRRIQGQSDWQLIASMNKGMKNGKLSIHTEGTGISDVSCDSDATEPPIIGPEDPINRSPKFEFGTIDCSSGAECAIKFDKKFNTVPLVFVMPVIDVSLTSRDDGKRITEYPSTVGVKDVTISEATIYQDFAPADKADVDDVDFIDKDKTPIGKIDYFAIEQGVLEFENGSKIVSGTTSYRSR